MSEELKHYKEVDGFKIGDEVYWNDGYETVKTTILDIYDDYCNFDDYKFICKYVKLYGGYTFLNNIFKDKKYANNKCNIKKKLYDNSVTNNI